MGPGRIAVGTVSAGLGVVGLAGIPEDIKTWAEWLTMIDHDVARWICFGIFLLGWIVVWKWDVLVRWRRLPKIDSNQEQLPVHRSSTAEDTASSSSNPPSLAVPPEQQSTSISVVSPPESAAPIVVVTKPPDNERQWCSRTPEQLMQLVRGHTGFAAKKAIQPFTGTWLALNGTVTRVEDELGVTVHINVSDNISAAITMKKRRARGSSYDAQSR